MKNIKNIEIGSTDETPYPMLGNEQHMFPDPVLKTIIDLKSNVFSKLKNSKKMMHSYRRDIAELFSENDKTLLVKMLDLMDTNHESIGLIKKIINNNIIDHNSSPAKKIDTLCELFEDDERFSQKEYTYFSKWFDLSDKESSHKKVEAIVNNKLYMAFPHEFNDPYDTQLYLHDDDILYVSDNEENNVKMVKDLKLIAIDKNIIVSSFSLNLPDSTTSNHMWGIYGDNGGGIALTYSIDALFKFWSAYFWGELKTWEFFFKKVDYDENYCPLLEFKKCCDGYLKSSKKEALTEFLNRFIFTKTKNWENENELRFAGLLIEHKKELKSLNESDYQQTPKEWDEVLDSIKDQVQLRDFVKPIKITLGWKCNPMDEKIITIIDFARNNHIQVEWLDITTINYRKKSFYKKKELEINP